MKSLKHNGAGKRKKSGQEVAKATFGKTDTRYWHDVIFKPSYTEHGRKRFLENWAARMQWRGRRELFNLNSSNKAAAASKAKDIYATLVGAGWDVALEKFKPEMKRKALVTVGDFIKELRGHWSGKPKTFEDYCQKFRTIVSQIFSIKGGKEKFDYVNGGRDAWIAKIGSIKLADVTPDKVNKWRIAFVKKAGGNPLEQRRARISCNSMIRQAKSLFAPDLLAHVAIHMPDKLPFDGVAFYERDSMRYHSMVDIETLISDAMRELPQEQKKIFLLATMVGLRRNEIDKLPWSAFRWNQGIVRIDTTEHFTPKTSDSGGDVPIDNELLALFRGWHAKATSSFVIESDGEARTGITYTSYRAQRDFDLLTAWLRGKGVTALKPLHELRKEFGSQVQKRGCTTSEFSAAGKDAESRAVRLQGELNKDDPRRSLLINTFQAYQQVALAISPNGRRSSAQSTDALIAAAGMRKTMLLRILEGNMTENEKNLYRVWLKATQ